MMEDAGLCPQVPGHGHWSPALTPAICLNWLASEYSCTVTSRHLPGESCHDPGDKVRSLSDSLAIIRELCAVDSEVTPGGSSIPLLDVCNIWDNLIFLS